MVRAFSATQLSALGTSDMAEFTEPSGRPADDANPSAVEHQPRRAGETQIAALPGNASSSHLDRRGRQPDRNQVGAMTTTQIAAMSTSQVRALTNANLSALAADQVAAMTNTQVAALTVTPAQFARRH